MTTTTRSISLHRTAEGAYVVTNARGNTLEVGAHVDSPFSPVELLLAGLAACAAIDIDTVVSRRGEPTVFSATSSGDLERGAEGNRFVDLSVAFDIDLQDASDDDRKVMARAAKISHGSACTVSRTIELGTPVRMSVSSQSDVVFDTASA